MAASYTVCSIPADKIDQAYPLAQLADAGLALEEWRRMCGGARDSGANAELVCRGTTVLVAMDQQGFVRAMCVPRVVRQEDVGHALDASVFVISAGLDIMRVAAAMLRGLVGLCRQRRCAELMIAVSRDDPRVMGALEEARETVPLLARDLAIRITSEAATAGA